MLCHAHGKDSGSCYECVSKFTDTINEFIYSEHGIFANGKFFGNDVTVNNCLVYFANGERVLYDGDVCNIGGILTDNYGHMSTSELYGKIIDPTSIADPYLCAAVKKSAILIFPTLEIFKKYINAFADTTD